MDSGRKSVSTFWLLQPELMSAEELREMLYSRCVPCENVNEMSKEMLIDLYRRVVLPLHQRDNCRKLSGNHSKSESALKTPDTSFKGSGFTIGFNGIVKKRKISGGGDTMISDSSFNERLKPPPSVVETSKKIKLNKSNSDLDKVIIINKNRRSHMSEEKQPSSVSNATSCAKTADSEVRSNGKCEESSVERPKKVVLKRSFIQQQSAIPKTEGTAEEKKQRMKITWP